MICEPPRLEHDVDTIPCLQPDAECMALLNSDLQQMSQEERKIVESDVHGVPHSPTSHDDPHPVEAGRSLKLVSMHKLEEMEAALAAFPDLERRAAFDVARAQNPDFVQKRMSIFLSLIHI